MSHVSTNPPWKDYPSRKTLISAHALENIENALDAAVTLAQQTQAAALEIPDANVSALIGNPATDTRQALDGIYGPLLAAKADKVDTYTKTQVDTLVAGAGGAGEGSVPNASTTTSGKVELATAAETAAGTDATRAVTPATIKPLLDAKANAGDVYTKTEVDTMVGSATAAGWLDPRDYGVVGDGVTNDSAAWAAFWTNIVPATGGRVVIHTPVLADPFVVQGKTNLTVECKPSGGLIMRDHDGGSTANRVGIKFLNCDGLRFDMQVWGDQVTKRVSETQPQSPLQVVSSVDVRGRGIGWDVRGGFVFVDVEDWTLTVEGEGFSDAPFYHRKVSNGYQYVAARRVGVDWQLADYNGTAGGYRNHCAGVKLREDCDNITITGWIDDVQGNGAAVGLTQGCSRIRVHDMMLTNVGSPWGVNTASGTTGKLNSDIMLERVRITARPEASLADSNVAHFDPSKPGMTVRDSTITGFDRSIALPHRSERITISDNPATTGYGAHMGIDGSILTSSVISNLGNRGLWVLADNTTVARNHFHNIPQQAVVREAGKTGPAGTTADRADSNTYTMSPVTNWFK